MTSPDLDVTIKRLRAILKRYGDAVPGLWSILDRVRWQSNAKWASWCYAPIELVRALLVGAAESSGFRNPKPLLTDLVAVAVFAAWRMAQGIYVFDSDVQHEIWNTPVSGEIPSDFLFHLPEWCCFVSAPRRIFDKEMLGFFVSLNSDSEQLRPELWLLVVYKEENVDVEPFCLALVGRITEAIRGGLAKLKRTTLAPSAEQKDAALVRLSERYVRHVQDLEGMVSLALYLAAENREISNPQGQEPQNLTPTRTKHGPRVFPPPAPKVWDVGVRLGAALRASREHHDRNGSQATIERTSPRGHIRRAHWHSFWTGPRDSETRVLRAKWLPPVAVNLPDVEDLPATIHKVEGRSS